MDNHKLLEGFLKKQKKGEGKTDNRNAVAALMSLGTSNEEKHLAKYLAGLHYSVCQNFFLEFCTAASDEEINNLINELLDDERMKTKNPTLFLYPKGLSAVYSLTIKEKYAPAFSVMNKILAKAEGKKGFAESIRAISKKIFTVDFAGLDELCNQLNSGKLKSKKEDRERLERFLEFVKVGNYEKAKTKEILTEMPKQEASIRFAEQINEIAFNMLSNIEKTQDEVVAMLKKLTADNEFKNKQGSESIELRKKVDELTERLRTSLQMNDVSKNQELLTLKSEISKAVKLDFADFERSKDKGHSKDLFKVYKSMLARIFKQLKRLDIPLV